MGNLGLKLRSLGLELGNLWLILWILGLELGNLGLKLRILGLKLRLKLRILLQRWVTRISSLHWVLIARLLARTPWCSHEGKWVVIKLGGSK